MQRNCIFPGRYAPLTYYEDVLEVSRSKGNFPFKNRCEPEGGVGGLA